METPREKDFETVWHVHEETDFPSSLFDTVIILQRVLSAPMVSTSTFTKYREIEREREVR